MHWLTLDSLSYNITDLIIITKTLNSHYFGFVFGSRAFSDLSFLILFIKDEIVRY